MNTVTRSILAASLVIAFAAPPADAQGPGGPGQGRGRGMQGMLGMQDIPRMMSQLDLTPEQKKKLEQLRQNNRENMQKLQEQVRASQEKLNQALQSDAKSSDLRKLHAEHEELRKKVADQRFEQILAVREVLTPEQRKKFQELRAQRQERGPGRGGPGMGMGGRLGGRKGPPGPPPSEEDGE